MKALVTARWTPITRILFRFFFVYMFLYLPSVLMNCNPSSEVVSDPYVKIWSPAVIWAGKHILHLSYDITVLPAGSGDTTWNYVQVFCMAVVAAAATTLWTILDWRRFHYRVLNHWLRDYVRLALALTMITYGSVKVIKTQFPSPSLNRLLEPIGETSPMGLLWTFMGASEGYNIFTGAGELLGGLLLISRRTTLLGALVSFGVATHVAALNYCYDVPVKLLSTHMLAMCIYLMLPDLTRLINFFVLNRPAPPVDDSLFRGWRWLGFVVCAYWMLFTLGFAAATLYDAHRSQARFGDATQKSALYGVWLVDDFTQQGVESPQSQHWRRLVFDFPVVVSIQLQNDQQQRYRVAIDADGGKINVQTSQKAEDKTVLEFSRPESDVLVIDGPWQGGTLHVKAHRMDTSKFLLTTRGFHWINELPFNR